MWVFTRCCGNTCYGLSGEYAKTVEYNEAGNKVSSAFGAYNLVAMFYAVSSCVGGWARLRMHFL
jgi:maltose/moltooligosaccharide transporter